MSQRSEQSAWEYVPGLLELMEEGLQPAELSGREFVSPQLRGGLSFATGDVAPEDSGALDNLWKWLSGFRRDATLCEREPIWVPIAEVWAAPGGSAEFRYETSSEQQGTAEISVGSLASFGGASRRELTTSITLPIDDAGAAYETRAFLTLFRYLNRRTGEELFRLDVDCAEATGEYRSRDLDPGEHPFGNGAPDRRGVADAGYVVLRVESYSERGSQAETSWREASLRSWNFSVGLDVPGLGSPLKLGVTCQNSKTFETKFVLPGRRDYAFCAPKGQAPIVPVCVALSGENGSSA